MHLGQLRVDQGLVELAFDESFGAGLALGPTRRGGWPAGRAAGGQPVGHPKVRLALAHEGSQFGLAEARMNSHAPARLWEDKRDATSGELG